MEFELSNVMQDAVQAQNACRSCYNKIKIWAGYMWFIRDNCILQSTEIAVFARSEKGKRTMGAWRLPAVHYRPESKFGGHEAMTLAKLAS